MIGRELPDEPEVAVSFYAADGIGVAEGRCEDDAGLDEGVFARLTRDTKFVRKTVMCVSDDGHLVAENSEFWRKGTLFLKKMQIYFGISKKSSTFARFFGRKWLPEPSKELEKAPGTLAQVVEQWTENPCVLGSTPRGTTKKVREIRTFLFVICNL